MSNKKGCGKESAPFLISISILSSWRGVHRQIWQVYFPWRFNDVEEEAGKWGLDISFALWDCSELVSRTVYGEALITALKRLKRRRPCHTSRRREEPCHERFIFRGFVFTQIYPAQFTMEGIKPQLVRPRNAALR